VSLLVETVVVDRNEEGKTRAHITYRFGRPEESKGEGAQGEHVGALENSLEFESPLVPPVSVGGVSQAFV
jgi:hypothetical protein